MCYLKLIAHRNDSSGRNWNLSPSCCSQPFLTICEQHQAGSQGCRNKLQQSCISSWLQEGCPMVGKGNTAPWVVIFLFLKPSVHVSKLIRACWTGGAEGKVHSAVSNAAGKCLGQGTNHQKLCAALQPTLLLGCSSTLCIMCCHGVLVCVSSAAFVLFPIGLNPKHSNAVVTLAGENKGDIIVWGFEHTTGSQFKVQPCVLVIQGVFWAQSPAWLCSLSVLCIMITECDGTQLIYRCLENHL